MMDQLNSDIFQYISQYLNVVDTGRLAATSKRFYYLAHQFSALQGPELVTEGSWDNGVNVEPKNLFSKAVRKLQSPPNLILAFNSVMSDLPFEIHELVLPRNAVVLGSISRTIQVNRGSQVECNSNTSLMLAKFPFAEIKPFCLERNKIAFECVVESFQEELNATNVAWTVFLVYGCGSRYEDLECFVAHIQRQYPNATIIGGVCSYGFVSREQPSFSKKELLCKSVQTLIDLNMKLEGRSIKFSNKLELVDHIYKVLNSSKYARVPLHVDDAVFGVALGGNVPIRSIASRGVRSLTHRLPQPSTKLLVQESTYVCPGDDTSDPHRNPFHLIHRIRDQETGTAFSFADLIGKIDNLHFVGLKRPGQNGFELHPVYSPLTGSFEIPASFPGEEETLVNANIDFFSVDGRSCQEHLDETLEKLRDQTETQQILGAMMFSSEYRGPYIGEGLVPEADVTRFAKVFPDVSCLGFYTSGEIGPLALAGDNSPIQQGKAALQGLTTVFALFMVPVADLRSYHIDDSPKNVSDFVISRLSRTTYNGDYRCKGVLV